MVAEMLYLNGSFMPLSEGRIHIEDRGFQLGDGVYEVVKVLNGRLVWLEDHLVRLERSLTVIKLSEALKQYELPTVLPRLVELSGLRDGMLYVQVTRGVAPRDFLLPRPPHPTVLAYARSQRPATHDEILEGWVLHPVEDQRWAHCDVKCTGLLAAVLAKEEAREAGAQEALFLGPDGKVREGGSSNVFAVLGGVLRTHPLDNHILAGITRKHLLEFARELGYKVEELAFRLEDVTGESSDHCEVFIANTIDGVKPVLRIGPWVVGDGRPGPVTLALANALRMKEALAVGAEPPPALS